ncbi:hypothetical protein [Yersinia pseudotuberculosis]|uniref:hypothetical protein n=1 Tax=Yersinia pseudotuberculosis TaxID=633 RepID=UPI0005E2859B|nr:hypothetical protein [Yersinia pseudotuberculosis]CNM03684.1 Uncharacterised protein [Yersinia pseudotuberculosis]
MKDIKEQDGYLIRNRWLLPLFVVLIVVTAQELVKSMPEFNFKIPDLIVYGVAVLAFIYAGFLNALAGTTTAKIFRGLIVVGLIAAALWFLVEKIQLF